MRTKLISALSMLALGIVVIWPAGALSATEQPIPPGMACASLVFRLLRRLLRWRHEALDIVKRYPTDFNGVLAVAPAHNWAPLLGIYQTWMARMNMDAAGKQILDPSKLPALHAAVIQAWCEQQGTQLVCATRISP